MDQSPNAHRYQLATLFFHNIYLAITSHSLITGFLHALDVLLLLWTMIELIKTELDHLKGNPVDVAVFVEVALVVVVREIIMLPVAETQLDWVTLGMWTGAAALLGLTYYFVRSGQHLLSQFTAQKIADDHQTKLENLP